MPLVNTLSLPIRVAIAQIPMYWEMAENVAAMKRTMALARSLGADLCAFSELALTGFHRRIAEWARPDLVTPAIDELCALSGDLGLQVAFGAPTFDAQGRRFNSHVFVDRRGRIAGTLSKVGLTEPEATFFCAGEHRPVVEMDGLRLSAVICREIEDHDAVVDDLAGERIDALLWPGQMRPDPALPIEEPPRHVARAQAMAAAVGTYIVQTNWPNALNRPAESEHTGHSACIAPTGELLFRLPVQGFGIGVFDLGQPAFTWRACT